MNTKDAFIIYLSALVSMDAHPGNKHKASIEALCAQAEALTKITAITFRQWELQGDWKCPGSDPQ